MVELPFTARQFFEVFRRYNEAIGSAQWVLYGVAAFIVVSLLRGERRRAVLVLLALLWLWMSVAYHATFLAAINPVAFAFAGLFAAEAVLLLDLARSPEDPAGDPPPRWIVIGARVFVAYALLGYPLIAVWAGQRYPEMPTFGAPCPTTIFTLGVLLASYPRAPWWLFAIPVLWSAIATTAALQLSVPEDFGLTMAGLFTIAVLAIRFLRAYPRPTPRASATRLI